MADKAAKSIWLRFFRDAGIPSGFDTKYALVFDENRIKMDMLMDLNKECLKDMGINAMGDIIAILKHAKQVYEESKTQAYDVPQPSSTVRIVNSSPAKSNCSGSSSASSTASRDPKSVIINSIKLPPARSSTAGSVVNQKTATSTTVSRQISSTKITGSGGGIKPKIVANTNGSRTICLKRSPSPPQREEVPFQKKTRVLPVHEGSYKVIMPEGSTPKTQKLLQDRLGPVTKSAPAADKKASVFSRLGGESKVSSSTDERRDSLSNDSSKKPGSIFARLGQGQTQSSTSTLPVDRNEFLKTKFEVRQKVTLPATDTVKVLRKSTSAIFAGDRFDREAAVVSSSASRLRSSYDGMDSASVKSRLGAKDEPFRVQGDRERPRPISPPVRRIDMATIMSPVKRPAESGPSFRASLPENRRVVLTGTLVPTKNGSESANVTVTRDIIRQERFRNAEGKLMVRKVFMKTTRKN